MSWVYSEWNVSFKEIVRKTIISQSFTAKNKTKLVRAPSNQGVSVEFLVKPEKLGLMKINVVAQTPIAGDAIEKLLPVEPEGLKRYGNDAVFINIEIGTNQTGSLNVYMPEFVVANSTSVSLSVIGGLIGVVKNVLNTGKNSR